jgi:hypothetical protein
MKHIATIINIINIFKNIMSKDLSKKPLGRWRIENCSKQMNHKVDLSNEDHCGPCGQYALSKNLNKDLSKNLNKDLSKNLNKDLSKNLNKDLSKNPNLDKNLKKDLNKGFEKDILDKNKK